MGLPRDHRVDAEPPATGALAVAQRLGSRLGSLLIGIAALATPLLIAAVVLGVIASLLRIEAVMRFAEPVPLLGRAITQNSLIDLQWHLSALMTMLAIPALVLSDRHVRVDVLYERLSPRRRSVVNLGGHGLLAIPFLVLAVGPAWTFMERSRLSGEGSVDGGLADRFLVKGLLPLGLGLLALALAIDILRRITTLLSAGRRQ
jgi:TRAP-type mannitol/chloroaromatic compound transport system permease small subunit